MSSSTRPNRRSVSANPPAPSTSSRQPASSSRQPQAAAPRRNLSRGKDTRPAGTLGEEDLDEEPEEPEEPDEDDGNGLREGLDPRLLKAFDGFSSMLERVSDRLDRLESKHNKSLGGGGAKGPLGDIDEDSEEDDEEDEEVDRIFAPVVRGRHGKCPPIDARFPHIDRKTLNLALAGTLPAASLPLLIPDSADIFNADEDDEADLRASPSGAIRFGKKKSGPQHAVSKFVRAIPDAKTFSYAWSILIELMCHGLGNDADAQQCLGALSWYGRWIIDSSVTFTWESICKYHIDACAPRFAGKFHVDLWYDKVATVPSVMLVRKNKSEARKEAGSSSAQNRKRKASPEPTDVSDQLCFAYNGLGCTNKNCKRKHRCSKCKKAHSANSCRSKSSK